MPSLKAETISFQMVIILQKLTVLNRFYRKTKLVALIHGHPVCVAQQQVHSSRQFYTEMCVAHLQGAH